MEKERDTDVRHSPLFGPKRCRAVNGFSTGTEENRNPNFSWPRYGFQLRGNTAKHDVGVLVY